MKKFLLSLLTLALIAGGGRYVYTNFFTIQPQHKNLAYATGSTRQVLDIYVPTTGSAPYPTVIQIHGGAFKMGDKTAINSVQRLLDEGYAIVSINYRLSSEAIRPAQLEDLRAAVRRIKTNANTYQLDPQRLASRGYSAGGHLSAMMGIALAGDPTTSIHASIDRFGPTDFWHMDADMQESGITPAMGATSGADSPESVLIGAPVGSNQALSDTASPMSYLSGGQEIPPFLIMHGAQDPMIGHKQSERLRDAIVQHGGTVQYHLLTGGTHGGGDFTTTATEDLVIQFLDTYLGKK